MTKLENIEERVKKLEEKLWEEENEILVPDSIKIWINPYGNGIYCWGHILLYENQKYTWEVESNVDQNIIRQKLIKIDCGELKPWDIWFYSEENVYDEKYNLDQYFIVINRGREKISEDNNIYKIIWKHRSWNPKDKIIGNMWFDSGDDNGKLYKLVLA